MFKLFNKAKEKKEKKNKDKESEKNNVEIEDLKKQQNELEKRYGLLYSILVLQS